MAEIQSLSLNFKLDKNKLGKKPNKFIKFNQNRSVLNETLRELDIQLQKFPEEISDGKRNSFKNEMKNVDNLITLNMKYFAGALVWIDSNNYTYPYKTININDKTIVNILNRISINQTPQIEDYVQLLIYIKRIELFYKNL